MRYIVDTNVAVVANGKSSAGTTRCAAKCSDRLTKLMNCQRLVIDDQWHILGEYRAHLNQVGQPGIGDKFYKWVLTNYRNTNRIECVQITLDKISGECTEFPMDERLNEFDMADRKFIAVSVVHNDHPPIIQAVDSEWKKFERVLKEHSIKIDFLCK